MEYKTEQERFWAGSFGSQYSERNQGDDLLASNLSLFSQALHKIQPIENMIEFGANIGMNLKALKLLFPNTNQYAIEIYQMQLRDEKIVIIWNCWITGNNVESQSGNCSQSFGGIFFEVVNRIFPFLFFSFLAKRFEFVNK